ncbi:MAG TPA: methyltransferase domain-containing protein [Vicinamibacterales bacterium]|nr:methyltransferase domain-containing protein [Vicinamibacterales bacterium]
MSAAVTPTIAETVDRVLAACGGGRTLHVGASADVEAWVAAFRRRAVEAETCLPTPRFPFADCSFDLVCVHGSLDHLDPADFAAAVDEALRVSRNALWIRTSGEPRDVRERAVLARACRKHPLYQTLIPYEGLDWQADPIDMLFERLPDGLTIGRSIGDLAAGRDLHMDMLREAGRRSDAHVARYALACRFIRPGDRVLDAACGLGYGSAILADATLAESVVGLDIDDDAVRYARDHYGRSRKRVRFDTCDAAGLDGLAPASFDAIVSFETLEHLEDPDTFLAACRRLLTPAGRIICSVPNQWVDETGEDPNPHHLHVYDREKLEHSCSRHFFVEQVFGQTAGGGMKLGNAGRRIWPADAWGDDAEWWLLVGMADPARDTAAASRSGLLEHPEDDATHVLAFDRDYDNPWLVRAMVTMGLRTESASLLELLAERTIATTPASSADVGAALCVSLYRAIERGETADAAALDGVAEYCAGDAASPHARRWQISLAYALGLYHLQRGHVEDARGALEACGRADALEFSPLLATKTVGACALLGWIAAQAKDESLAREWWTRGIDAAERALHRPWDEILLSRRSPAVFGLREAALVVDLASQCATGLHLLTQAAGRPGILASQFVESLAGRAAAWERRYRAVRLEFQAVQATLGESPETRFAREHFAASWLIRGDESAPGKRVAVFGAGSGGRQAIDMLRSRDIDVVCIADNNIDRHGETIDGVPVIAPADLATHQIDAIVVASIPYRYQIFEQLEALGFRHGRDFDVCSFNSSLARI